METTKAFYNRTHKEISYATVEIQVGEEEINREIEIQMNELSSKIKDLRTKATNLEKENERQAEDLQKGNRKCSNALQEVRDLKTRLEEEMKLKRDFELQNNKLVNEIGILSAKANKSVGDLE